MVGFAAVRTLRELFHQVLVDVQPPGGVEDHYVLAGGLRCLDPVLDDLDRILGVLAVDGNLDLTTELLELVDRGGALQVGGDERRLLARFPEQQRELRRRRRLARALEADHQDHRRRLPEGEPRVALPISAVSSSCTIFTTCWPGSSPFRTSGRSLAP